MNEKQLRILGLAATAIGIGANLLSGYVADKQLDDKIAKKVTEALSKSKN